MAFDRCPQFSGEGDPQMHLLIEFAECYADSLHAAAERVRVRLDDVA